ncbi:MAG: beta-propeller domain-containing protein [Planctomycetales bacterium]|jgi:outer membrane protein assembly factor BamB
MIRRSMSLALIFAAAAISVLPAEAADSARRFAASDSSKKRIAIIDRKGDIEWEYKIGSLHDLHVLPTGNVLFQTSMTRLLEVDPKTDKVVWEYDSASSNGNKGRPVQVHAFQRLADGVTMIAESGPARIIEVDKSGKLLKEVALKVDHPHVHRDTRLARKIDNGNYLVCHEADGTVREYDSSGKVVWGYEVPLFGKEPKRGHGLEAFGNQCFSVLRLKNGNTLIGTGNGHSILEVTPKKKIVWSIHQNDLEGIQLAWVTSLQVLPSGNILIGNCHAGPDNPQLIEVTRDKKVVWKFHDFERFGNALTNSQILFD